MPLDCIIIEHNPVLIYNERDFYGESRRDYTAKSTYNIIKPLINIAGNCCSGIYRINLRRSFPRAVRKWKEPPVMRKGMFGSLNYSVI